MHTANSAAPRRLLILCCDACQLCAGTGGREPAQQPRAQLLGVQQRQHVEQQLTQLLPDELPAEVLKADGPLHRRLRVYQPCAQEALQHAPAPDATAAGQGGFGVLPHCSIKSGAMDLHPRLSWRMVFLVATRRTRDWRLSMKTERRGRRPCDSDSHMRYVAQVALPWAAT